METPLLFDGKPLTLTLHEKRKGPILWKRIPVEWGPRGFVAHVPSDFIYGNVIDEVPDLDDDGEYIYERRHWWNKKQMKMRTIQKSICIGEVDDPHGNLRIAFLKAWAGNKVIRVVPITPIVILTGSDKFTANFDWKEVHWSSEGWAGGTVTWNMKKIHSDG